MPSTAIVPSHPLMLGGTGGGVDARIRSARGRSRTGCARFRKPALYPLSYKGVRHCFRGPGTMPIPCTRRPCGHDPAWPAVRRRAPRPGVEPESMRGRPPRGMRANAPDTYARPRSAMPIKPVSPAGFQTPFHGPALADRRADGARVELARGFRPNSLSGTAPLPHGPPSMPVFRRAGTPGEVLTFCELSRRMRVPRQSSCAPPPGFGPEPHARLRRAMGASPPLPRARPGGVCR